MIGGINSNPVFTLGLEESQLHYESNALTQLQLFGNFPAGIDVDPGNCTGNDHIPALSRPIKRSREAENSSSLQMLQISLNNHCQEDADQLVTIPNSNAVSTGLRLSYDDDEHNSSVTSASGSMPPPHVIMSLGDSVRNEIDRQNEEYDHYTRIQEEHIVKGVREMKQRHVASFLGAVEKEISRKLREKELQIENINKNNNELLERMKQAAKEAQSWHYQARHNESLVNVLKNNLKQAIALGGDVKEGCGDSEVDDAASSYNPNVLLNAIPQNSTTGMKGLNEQMLCKSCKSKEISMLLLPCRHLCLCKDCEALIDLCPVCHYMKAASVQVYMS